jgi:hypothetical protein
LLVRRERLTDLAGFISGCTLRDVVAAVERVMTSDA